MSADRGQTLPDFAVGIAIFLIAIAFVVLFVPQLTAPYDDQETPAVAERVASELHSQQLSAADTAAGINETCTIAFFERNEVAGCPAPQDSLTDQVGIDGIYRLNVSLREPGDEEMLCHDGETIGSCSSGTPLVVGDADPEGDHSVSTARVTVTVDGDPAILQVEVW